jgi:predicted N-formylglutamate amidohydrolase
VSPLLLASDEPAPFEAVEGQATSPFVLLCDHASPRIPRALESLGLPAHELTRHIAWDIGAAGLARELAHALGAILILQSYSRLVIDCNRPLGHGDSIAVRSEDTEIPGNHGVSPAEASARAERIFEPYHARIRAELDARAARRQPTVLVFVHSFTPVYRGVPRAWHAGVLYHRDTRLARPMLDALRREAGLIVGDNEPYAASPLTDYGLVEHGERRGLPHVELEVRQDLIGDAAGQRAWAERLTRLLRETSAGV